MQRNLFDFFSFNASIPKAILISRLFLADSHASAVARFENDVQGSCNISPRKGSTRGRTLTELSAVNTGHAAGGFTTPENMDAQSPFHPFPAVPVGRRQDVTSPLSVIPPFFLPFLLFPSFFLFFFFFFTNPRGERKERVALKEFGDSFFLFFREQTREHWRSLTNPWTGDRPRTCSPGSYVFDRRPIKSVRNTRFAASGRRFFDRFFCRRKYSFQHLEKRFT